MSAISRTGHRADDLMLMEAASKLVDGEEQRSSDSAIDKNDMFLCVDVRDLTVISIVAAAFGDEAEPVV